MFRNASGASLFGHCLTAVKFVITDWVCNVYSDWFSRLLEYFFLFVFFPFCSNDSGCLLLMFVVRPGPLRHLHLRTRGHCTHKHTRSYERLNKASPFQQHIFSLNPMQIKVFTIFSYTHIVHFVVFISLIFNCRQRTLFHAAFVFYICNLIFTSFHIVRENSVFNFTNEKKRSANKTVENWNVIKTMILGNDINSSWTKYRRKC